MKKLFVFTDGGARGNPGPAAIGVIIKTETEQILAKLSRRIGITTNNLAEYSAVIAALKWIEEKGSAKGSSPALDTTGNQARITFFLDSVLVVNQLNGLFKVKDNELREKIMEIRQLEQAVGGNVVYNVIPREKNWQADALVNQALDNQY
ncbi:ribonuclease HI family protein [Candidatus Gottesmanbacteria bacterium]|nr:ribonuclease HI family protein [Candidatus Gottesmanbacteria bacterium]